MNKRMQTIIKKSYIGRTIMLPDLYSIGKESLSLNLILNIVIKNCYSIYKKLQSIKNWTKHI